MSNQVNSKITHQYDPNIVFHSHSSNLPHLYTWIEELIANTENSLPKYSSPATTELVESVQRYDSCFRELLRQTSIFSDDLTKLLAKVWIGVLNLLDYMVKLYHRHVKQTSRLQDEAQRLVIERQSQLVSAKVKQEEGELEQTSLRAKIRNLEAGVESMNASQSSLERENAQLRLIIEEYIMGQSNSNNENKAFVELDSVGNSTLSQSYPSISLRNSTDVGKEQLKALCRIDLEMNDILFNIIQEEDRQKVVLTDLTNLIHRNYDFFGKGTQQIKRSNTRVLENPKQTTTTSDAANQVDEKDTFIVVDEYPTNINTKDHRAVTKPPSKPATFTIKGFDIPYQLRRKMTYFPSVLRIPPLDWTCQTIMLIYIDKINTEDNYPATSTSGHSNANASNNISGFKTRETLCDLVYSYFRKILGIDTITDVQMMQLVKACEHHIANKRVLLFSKQLGINDKESEPDLDIRDTEFIMFVLKTIKSVCAPPPLTATNTSQLAQTQTQTQTASGDPRSAISVALSRPLTGENDPHFEQQDEISKRIYVHHPSQQKAAIPQELPRHVALNIASSLFGKWLHDGSEDFIRKVNGILPSSGTRTYKLISTDDFIECAVEQWNAIRSNWTEHLRFLFRHHAHVYRIVAEAQFANDLGASDRDVILVQVAKESLEDFTRRPSRFFRRPDSVLKSGGTGAAGMVGGDLSVASSQNHPTTATTQGTGTGIGDTISASLSAVGNSNAQGGQMSTVPAPAVVSNKEAICELLDKKGFKSAMREINPKISANEIEELLAEAVEWTACAVDRCLEKFWTKTNTVDDKVFYINNKTGRTQWTQPFRPRTFRSPDIEEDAFIAVALQRNLIPKSPLLESLHVAPKDLWPNADMFHKQLINVTKVGLNTNNTILPRAKANKPVTQSLKSLSSSSATFASSPSPQSMGGYMADEILS